MRVDGRYVWRTIIDGVWKGSHKGGDKLISQCGLQTQLLKGQDCKSLPTEVIGWALVIGQLVTIPEIGS